MTQMPHLPLMQWDFKDQLQASAKQVRTDGGTPEITYYIYDAAGQRVRKVTERQAALGEAPTRMKERIYLGGFELYREYSGHGEAVTLERETLHVMDEQQRIALVETQTTSDPDQLTEEMPLFIPLVRYQLGNHLGSASVELDDVAKVISYEEYTPYGSSSYQAIRGVAEVSLKRYRYTGKERDEETGLSYHGARYYVTWLGRWSSTDPLELVDGINLWIYTHNNPITSTDPTGTMTTAQERAYLASQRASQAARSKIVADVSSAVAETRVQRAALKSGTTRLTFRQALRFTLKQSLRRVTASAVGVVSSAAGATGVGAGLGVVGYSGLVYIDNRVDLGLAEGWFTRSAQGWRAFRDYASEHGLRSAIAVATGTAPVQENPPLDISPETGTPNAFLSDSPIGPSYATLEEAHAAAVAEANQRSDATMPHITYNALRNKITGAVVEWFEISERGLGKGMDQPIGDTEQKALARLNSDFDYEDYDLLIVGKIAPCDRSSLGCDVALRENAKLLNLDITYVWNYKSETRFSSREYTPDGAVRFKSNGEYTSDDNH